MTKEQISRIVRGNDFSMEITVLMPEYEVNATQWIDFDISSCNNVAVNLICTKDQVVIPLDWHIKENTNNVIIADVKGKYLHSGTVYSLEITGLDSEGRAWRYKNKQVFSIVDSTSQAALAPTLMADPLELNATVCLAVKVMPIEVEGPQGVTGLQGPTGPAGEKGQDGTISFDELTPEQKESLIGEQGVTGLQGEVGPRGVRGVTGQVGPTGRQGVTGLRGVTGQQGITGQRGPTGPTGRQGVTGLKGVTGLQGIQGVTGMTGPIGRQGATGARGVTGAKGLMGDDGITTLYDAARDLGVYEGNVEDFPEVLVQWSYAGDEAIQEMNQKQDTLVSGRNIKTINGESLLGSGNITIEGGAGTSGPQGVTGLRGVTGARGASGPQGVTGQRGPTGPAGKDGQSADYSKQYLTFESLEDNNTFTFTTNDLEYSIDGGTTWSTLTAGSTSPVLSKGDTIMWKQTGLTPTSSTGIGTFSATGRFKAYGNIMSIVEGYPAAAGTFTLQQLQFVKLFNNNIYLTDASKLILPATTLGRYCYYQMFTGCTSLTTAPELPATTLANYCYYQMFTGCSSLTTAPELPATTLANYCYCEMFRNCTNLTTAPELPATTLAEYCYDFMFGGCSSLTTAPELPATTLASSCYHSMFERCTNLTTAPELPATTLAQSCYYFMFKNCSSLTTAPELPATNLATKCYQYMFQGCTSLNYIKCLATDISASNCTNNWANGVSQTGTFITNDNPPAWTTGTGGIPTGWNVYTETEYSYVRHYELPAGPQGVTGIQGPQGETGPTGPQGVTGIAGTTDYTELENRPQTLEDLDYGAAEQLSANTWAISDIQTQLDLIDYSIEYLTFEVLDNNTSFKFSTNTLYYDINNEPGGTLEPDTWTPTFSIGDKIRFYATISSVSTSTGIGTFSATGRFKAYGNIMSIVEGYPSAAGTFTVQNYQFYKLFYNNTYLVDASKLILPSTTLANRCYTGMFDGCTSLTTAPELPATTLANYCYCEMFRNCTNLTTAPELPATTLAEYCYDFMFGGCSSLTSAPELPATTLVSNCYCFMFLGCTSLNYIKCLATDISASNCTYILTSNVSQTGTFITNDNPPAWTTGTDGIPTGWNAYTETEYSYVRHYEQPNTSYFVQSVGTTGLKIEVVQSLPVNPDSSTIYIIQ